MENTKVIKQGIVDIIGFGLSISDLTETHKRIIQKAELLVGGKRLLTQLNCLGNNTRRENSSLHHFNKISCETLLITKNIDNIIKKIMERVGQGKRVVVLASGDPMFHGIGATLVKTLGKDNINIYPNISSVAAAFSAIKEPWEDALLISLHGKHGKELDKELQKLHKVLTDNGHSLNSHYSLQTNKTPNEDYRYTDNIVSIAILTDNIKTPAWLAQYIISNYSINNNLKIIVLENIGDKNQQISFFDEISVVANKNFQSPNLVIIKLNSSYESLDSSTNNRENSISQNYSFNNPKTLKYKSTKNYSDNCSQLNIDDRMIQPPIHIFPGMPDDLFAHDAGLITKSEVRAVVLSKLQLSSDDLVFWDLGAGSGSVSIEVSRFIPKGKIIAVEKNESRVADIIINMERFGFRKTDRVGESCIIDENELGVFHRSWRNTRGYPSIDEQYTLNSNCDSNESQLNQLNELITDDKSIIELKSFVLPTLYGECSMTVIHGFLPKVLNYLPEPDRVFIGGGGKDVEEIIIKVAEKLSSSGIVVINTVLIQTMNSAISTLKKMSFHVKLTHLQVSFSKEMPFGERLEPLNPVWIISGTKMV